MSEQPTSETSTPAATAAAAQTHDETVPAEAAAPVVELEAKQPGKRGVDFEIGNGVVRAQWAYAEPSNRDDPTYREVSIYTIDPSASREEGSIARVRVNYEPLQPGPVGAHFKVSSVDADRDKKYAELDLDDPRNLIRQGRKPSPSDPQFHQQMTYTVCSHVYDAFNTALGRHPAWGFDKEPDEDRNRLTIFPFGMEARNAYYERSTRSLKFGYFAAKEASGRNLRNGWVFTSLSHDIIVHEVTHAFLDGLRSHFLSPTGQDVLAFHEAFADIVAVFQRFSYEKVVEEALRKARGAVGTASVLTDLARQFGNTIGKGAALRTTNDLDGSGKAKQLEDAGLEPHDRGSVLTSAVYAAFTKLFEKKTRRYLLLATGGTGILPEGEIPVQLREVLAKEASQLASHCLSICIRAIDFCPPVDVDFGEYLRAIITADHDLVPDDHWGYREAWVDAFWERGIYPYDVANLSEDALLWRKPRVEVIIEGLSYSKLAFRGDPNSAPFLEDLEAQAAVLGACVTSEDLRKEFGLVKPGKQGDSQYDLPIVQSIRTSRRVGPDHQVAFDLVAEVTQRRTVQREGRSIEFIGGSTIIVGPNGDVRYVISKRVDNDKRLTRQVEFMTGAGRAYWAEIDGTMKLSGNPLKLVHGEDNVRFGLSNKEAGS